jgi:hypothetical protein
MGAFLKERAVAPYMTFAQHDVYRMVKRSVHPWIEREKRSLAIQDERVVRKSWKALGEL